MNCTRYQWVCGVCIAGKASSHTSAARRAAVSFQTRLYSPAFLPITHESCPTMEINPILNTIKDLTERSESIRGYL
ncbi:hypothetical protein D3C80_266240 [compost metagenome]|jgi:hypothetical protein